MPDGNYDPAADLTPVYQSAGQKYGIDPDLLRAQTRVESSDNPYAVSSAGAEGMSQFIPSTAATEGLKDPYDPHESIPAQAKLLRENANKYGSMTAAIGAYHSGTGDPSKWGPATNAYLDSMNAEYARMKQAAPPPQEQQEQQPSITDQINTARKAGYNDGEIASYLQQSKAWAPKFDEARKAGYLDDEVLQHFGLKVQPGTPLTNKQSVKQLPMAQTEAQAPLPAQQPAPANTPQQWQWNMPSGAQAVAQAGMPPQPAAMPAPQASGEPTPQAPSQPAPGLRERYANSNMAIGNAIVDAWNNSPGLLTPWAQGMLNKTGLGGVTMLADTLFNSGPSAVFAGGLEALNQIGGRHLAEIGESVMTQTMGEAGAQHADEGIPAVRNEQPAAAPVAERPPPTDTAPPAAAQAAPAAPAVQPDMPMLARKAAQAQRDLEATPAAETGPPTAAPTMETPAPAAPVPPQPSGRPLEEEALAELDPEVPQQGPPAPAAAEAHQDLEQIAEGKPATTAAPVGNVSEGQSQATLPEPSPPEGQPLTPGPVAQPPVSTPEPTPLQQRHAEVSAAEAERSRAEEQGTLPTIEVTPKPEQRGKQPTPFEPTPKEPQRLIDFLRSKTILAPGTIHEQVIPGGIRDTGGDLRAILGGSKGRPGLINNASGMSLHDKMVQAWSEGYFPELGEEPPTDDGMLLDAIRDDHTGTARYSIHDQDAADAYRAATEGNSEIDRLAAEHGIETRGKTRDQFFDELHDNMSLAAREREIASQDADHEAAYREAEKQAKQWVAYHGTPHEFDQFDMSKIGTGEGAQAYGHGLYFAENPRVAGEYREKLAPGINDQDARGTAARLMASGSTKAQALEELQRRAQSSQDPAFQAKMQEAAGYVQRGEVGGSLYQVRLHARPEEMLDWDKPLSEQPAGVRDALLQAHLNPAAEARRQAAWEAPGWSDHPKDIKYEDAVSAGTTYDALASELGSASAVSDKLKAAGIKGIRYLDRGSRGAGEGSHNVVMFDPRDIEITHRNGEPVAPEAWNAKHFYGTGQARTLEDLEREYAEEAQPHPTTAAPSERAAGEPEHGPPGRDQGAVPEGGEPRRGGAGDAARVAEANDQGTDLLGRQVTEPRAKAQPEPTIRNDTRQDAMPGMESSAVQAQAARDAEGRGALQADVAQKPADEGLFAPDTSGQGTLYAGPGAVFDPQAWRRAFGPFAPAAIRAVSWAKKGSDMIANGLAPMRSGSVRAQAWATDFANSLRQVNFHYGEIDREIERRYKPSERAAMGAAMDAQSVFEQQLRDLPADQQAAARAQFDAGGTGIAGLRTAQQSVLRMLDTVSQGVWERMRERGMVSPQARGLPFYFPRQILTWSEENGFERPGGGGQGAGRNIEPVGGNLTTQGPMRREHLTPEETEAAAQSKFGPGAAILTDIRMLPSRLAQAERAIAGSDLMSQIERVGNETGVNLVTRGDIPGLLNPADYFTIEQHPAFRQFTGTGWKAIHVSKEFEGPLRAVLTKSSGDLYRGAMALKSGVMSAIMYSPFIHLAVELGRSLPVMPLRVLSLQALRDGSRLRGDMNYMDRATTDGLAPLGRSGWRTDPISLADQANDQGGNRFVRAIKEMRDNVARGAGAVLGQTAQDIIQHPHQTLLWDQVFNLQVGLYDGMRNKWIEKGYPPEVAGQMAAHIANRYAGALPPEHLARGANMAANMLLFSRSFTLGNMGVMKDMLTGAPGHLVSRLQQMAGPEMAASAQSAMRRKAIAAFTMDIGMFYLANGLLQSGLQVMRNASAQGGVGPAAQQMFNGWYDEATSAVKGAGNNPLSIFGVLPQHWNEPGKQDRVFAGTDDQQRGIYLRLPAGKVGEEFLGWFAKPGTMLVNKASPLVRPIIEDAIGYDSLGRGIYKPDPQTMMDYIGNVGRAVQHIATNLGPTSTIEGGVEEFRHHVLGEPAKGDQGVSALKLLGPMTGLAQVSSGFPGGPAAGEMHAQSEREKFDLQQAMPAIREKIKAGDTEGAVADMTALNVPPALRRYYLRQTVQPGPSKGALRRLPNAPADVQERVRRQMGQQP